jgi:hypothetical protein
MATATATRKAGRQEARLATLMAQLREMGWRPGEAAGWDEDQTRRWYTALVRSGTTARNLPLACICAELLYAQRPDTVRGNMYMVTSHPVGNRLIPDTSQPCYDRVQRLLSKLRMKNVIPFEWVVDNVRGTIKPSSWAGLEDFAETVAQAYRLDFWSRLPDYIELIVEKDAVAGRVARVTREYDVPLHPIRGYNSATFAHDIATGWDGVEKPITIYYVGDHDPSGRDLERDIRERLEELSGRQFAWRRLAVNPGDFARYNIAPLAPKTKDARCRKFVERWGERCAEVEAIPAPELRRIVREAIESHIPAGDWARLLEVERIEREQWVAYMSAMLPALGR